MDDIFTVEFQYNNKSYSALVRIKNLDSHTRFCITVMNGDIERKLYGNNFLTIKDGQLVSISDKEMSPEVALLQSAIAGSLEKYLKSHTELAE
jgi:arginine deiminase